MKRNVIALACTAVLALALALPAMLQAPSPAGETSAPAAAAQANDGKATRPDAPDQPDAAVTEPAGNPPDETEYVPGEMLVGLAEGATAAQVNELLPTLDYVATQSVSDDDILFGYVKLSLADGVEVEDALARIADEPLVEAAQPDYVYTLMDATDEDEAYSAQALASAGLQAAQIDDGALSAQSSVINDPQVSEQWALEAVHAYEAWDYARAEGEVTVAVIDTGVNVSHEDLVDRIVNPYNVLDKGTDVTDDVGHGTHVAGIIAATTNNGKGVSGLSYNANIMPVKVMNEKTASTSSVIAGMNYAINSAGNKVKVINISLGTSSEWTGSVDNAFKTAITQAHNKGILLVYAGCNYKSGESPSSGVWNSFPCDFDTDETGKNSHPGSIGVINVMKSGSTYARQGSSNYNVAGYKTKTLSAPGTNILSTSSTSNTGYRTDTGTSMAAPCVAGIAALLFAADGSMTAERAKAILEKTAQDLGPTGWDNETGYGMVDAAAALKMAAPSSAPTLTPGLSAIGIGGSTTLTVNGGDSLTWTWTTSDSSVATVSAGNLSATVTGVATGSVTVTATSGTGIALSQTIDVIDPRIVGPEAVLVGSTAQLSVEGYAGTWIWSIAPGDSGASIDEDTGLLTAGNHPGNINVKAVLKDNETVSMTYALRVAQYDISKAAVEDVGRQPYTGSEIAPSPVVKLNGETLGAGTDYTCAYSDNVNPGTATITLTGAGKYLGTKAVTFEIYSDFQENAQVTFDDTPKSYTGSAITLPTEGDGRIVVTYNGNTLAEGADYDVSYSGNVNAGTATVTITGKGTYIGSVQKQFTIVAENLASPTRAVSATAAEQTYTGKPLEPAPTVTWGTQTLTKDADYTVTWSNNTNAGTASFTITGKGNFTGTVSGTFKIKPAQLKTLKLSQYSYTYDGSAKSPTVTVYGSANTSMALTHDVDYTVTPPAGRTNAGTYTYTATGKGNYTGTASATLTVNKATVATMTLSTSSYTYDGRQKSPTVTVRDQNGATLPASAYTLATPTGRTNAGTYTYVAKANGSNYQGTARATLSINKAVLTGMALSATSYAYDGKQKSPTVTVTGPKNGSVSQRLTSGTDYTLATPTGRTNAGTYTYTATGKGNYTGTRSASFTITAATPTVSYRTHVQNVGWQSYVTNGATAGTSGQSLRLEAINIALSNASYSGSIQYRTHIQNIGWESSWKSNNALSGTSGQSLRLEAIQIRLTGDMANHYDVYYRVHCQNIGWMGWAKNGASAGSAGFSYRLEAIQVKLVAKGASAPGSTSAAFRNSAGDLSGVPDSESLVLYRTHVQNDGWQNYMRDGETAGTSGRSLRLEGINIQLGDAAGSGGIEYRTHVQNIGWQGWVSNGTMAGTSGRSLRLEAIQIRLTGSAAQKYDVYYRVHAQNIGWMGWAKNGNQAGTAGYSYRLEAIQVRLVAKGGAAPGSTANAFRSR